MILIINCLQYAKERDIRESYFFIVGCLQLSFSLVKLAENFVGNFFGAINEFFLVMGRSEGTFLNEFSDLSPWENDVICDRHLNELSRDYFNAKFGKLKWMKVQGDRVKACGYPEVHTSQGKRTMSHTMSKNVLYERSILVPAGTRELKTRMRDIVCSPLRASLRRHSEAIRLSPLLSTTTRLPFMLSELEPVSML